jgi:hypothetical protein
MDTSSHVALEAGWLNLTVKLLNFRKPVEWEDCYGLPSHSSLLAYYAGDSLQACWTRGSFCWYIDRVTLRLLEQLEDHFCWSLTGPPSSGADHEIDSWSNGLPSFAGHHQIPWGWEFGVCILDSTLGVRYNLKIFQPKWYVSHNHWTGQKKHVSYLCMLCWVLSYFPTKICCMRTFEVRDR